MKKFNKIFLTVGVLAAVLGLNSCVNDLELTPNDPTQRVDVVNDIDAVFADIYLNFASAGPNGSTPVEDFDGGMATFSRAIFIGEEIPTDEACWLWDPDKYGRLKYGFGAPDIPAILGIYSRLIVNVTLCNKFISQVQSGEFSYPAEKQALVDDYIRQARILRGACYFYILSFYENPPFADETFPVGAIPTQPGRAEVYNWVVNDLESVASWYLQNDPNNKPFYGFVGLDVCESILAKLYLNAEVFAGTPQYDKCYAHCKNIIDRLGHGGFYGTGLAKSYKTLFGYNNKRFDRSDPTSDVNEIIWSIIADRTTSVENLTSWAGATFWISAWNGDSEGSVTVTIGRPTDDEIYKDAPVEDRLFEDSEGINRIWEYCPSDELEDKTKAYADADPWKKVVWKVIHHQAYSNNPDMRGWILKPWVNNSEGWKCMVTRESFVNKFDWDDLEMSQSPDTRVDTWYTSEYNFNVHNVSLDGDDWGNNGYIAIKYTNWAYDYDGNIDYITSAAQIQPNGACGGNFAAIRLAEIYLTAAEAILNGGGGSNAEATDYVNRIRQRAYGDTDHNFASLSMTDLRNERARELYTENCRRTDLIRWNQWCAGYTWDWKGGVKSGTSLPEYTKSFPFPTSAILTTGMKQQTGY